MQGLAHIFMFDEFNQNILINNQVPSHQLQIIFVWKLVKRSYYPATNISINSCVLYDIEFQIFFHDNYITFRRAVIKANSLHFMRPSIMLNHSYSQMMYYAIN